MAEMNSCAGDILKELEEAEQLNVRVDGILTYTSPCGAFYTLACC